MEAVRFLVERCGVQINTQDRFGMTPLNRAEQVSMKRQVLQIISNNIFRVIIKKWLGTWRKRQWNRLE